MTIPTIALLGLAFGYLGAVGLAQTPGAGASPPSALGEVDTYVKIVGTAFTAVATLIGLPIVRLTYRKTRAEIAKLELEAKALLAKEPGPLPSRAGHEGIRIVVDRCQNTSVNVLADPRFLAPLLVLLDFIFASVVLTLAGNVLSMLSLGVLRAPALTVLAAALLLPIARQVLRVQTLLKPPRTAAELRALQKQSRTAFIAVYAIMAVSSLAFGILVLTVAKDNLTEIGRYLGWALTAAGAIAIAMFQFSRRRFDRYLSSLYAADAATGSEA